MGADRREQILAAAYEIVGREGLEGIHARSVAAKVGINHAAVHYYYPKRSDLLIAVSKYAMGRFMADREKLSLTATSPVLRIEAQMAQAEAYSKPHSRFLKNWTSFFVAAIMDEGVKREIADHLKEWAGTLIEEIRAGCKSGSVRQLSPFANADLLVASLLGIMLMAHTLGPEFDASEKLDLIAGSLLA